MDLSLDTWAKIAAFGASLVVVFGGLGGLFKLLMSLRLLDKSLQAWNLKLEPTVSGTVITHSGTTYLIAKPRIKNVGATSFTIEQQGTALIVSSYEPVADLETSAFPVSKVAAAYSVFEEHQFIEPGESIEESRIIAVPKDDIIAFRLELRIVSTDLAWKAESVVAMET